MSDVKVRVRRVEALFDTKLTLPGAELFGELLLHDDLAHRAREEFVDFAF